MIGTVKSLLTTLRLAFRKPVTLQYPSEPPPLAPRFMAHPVLTWDGGVNEPYCTGCLVCARVCPTDCITVSMKDNPKFATGESTRRKIVDDFELNVADCIMCSLCVEYCNFDAILMSDHFDKSQSARTSLVLGLEELLEDGREQETKGRWQPPTVRKAQRRAAVQGGTPAPATATAVEERAGGAPAPPVSTDDRVAAGRARAAALREQRDRERAAGPSGDGPQEAPAAGAAPAGLPSAPSSAEPADKPIDPRVAEARRKAAELRAERATQRAATPAPQTSSSGEPAAEPSSASPPTGETP